MFYMALFVTVLLGCSGTYLAFKVIGHLSNKRSRYGFELLFESKSTLDSEGIKYLNLLRAALALFIVSGYCMVYVFNNIN